MNVLQVVSCAYRATVEEQDDTVLWFSHAIKNAGCSVDVLLRANAVNYAVCAQDAGGLAFGDWRQTQPPQLPRDIAALVDKGMAVYVIDEDLTQRGVDGEALIPGIQRMPRAGIAELVELYDKVWQW